MTAAEFRRFALAQPGAVESSHMGHPDFRVGRRIFATLGYPDPAWAMIRLPPDDQDFLLRSHPAAFTPAPGAWGRDGATLVRLDLAARGVVRDALAVAARAAAPAPRRRRS